MLVEQLSQKFEGSADDFPSDYFECLKPVCLVGDMSARSDEYFKRFRQSGNIKELITSILLAARDTLAEEFGFKELTVLEIKSLVEISGRIATLVTQAVESNQISAGLSFGGDTAFQWLYENYGISIPSREIIEDSLMEEESKQGHTTSKLLHNRGERDAQFIDYIRKVRDKALLAEKNE